jgi:hypothetical protein
VKIIFRRTLAVTDYVLGTKLPFTREQKLPDVFPHPTGKAILEGCMQEPIPICHIVAERNASER